VRPVSGACNTGCAASGYWAATVTVIGLPPLPVRVSVPVASEYQAHSPGSGRCAAVPAVPGLLHARLCCLRLLQCAATVTAAERSEPEYASGC
jgi:hypothetical protein